MRVWAMILSCAASALMTLSAAAAQSDAPVVKLLPPIPINYFIGTWTCSTDLRSQVVKAYGLAPDQSTVYLSNAYIGVDRHLYINNQQYMVKDGVTTVSERIGARSFVGNTVGWVDNKLEFDGTAVVTRDPSTAEGPIPGTTVERMIYARKDADHFQRTFEAQVDSAAGWRLVSRESCARVIGVAVTP